MLVRYLMCDRCKQKMTEYEGYVIYTQDTISYLKGEDNDSLVRADLCKNCYNELRKFLGGKNLK